MSIVMILFNWLMKPISEGLTKCEMHETYSNNRISFSLKLVVSWYINVCLIPYITYLSNHLDDGWLEAEILFKIISFAYFSFIWYFVNPWYFYRVYA